MTVKSLAQLEPDELRRQADRCRRLSRSSMDFGTIRDLRWMSEEYIAEAAKRDAASPHRPEGTAS